MRLGCAPCVKSAVGEIEVTAPTQGRVLIFGENGTGKELVARTIHRLSLRRDEPLVVVENTVDWHESRKLLKVAFDWSVAADSATYEIAYGAIGAK